MTIEEAKSFLEERGCTVIIPSSQTNMGGGVTIGLLDLITYKAVITNGTLKGRITKQNANVWHGSNAAKLTVYNTLQNNMTDMISPEYRMDMGRYSDSLFYGEYSNNYHWYGQSIALNISKNATNNRTSEKHNRFSGRVEGLADCYPSMRPLIFYKEI